MSVKPQLPLEPHPWAPRQALAHVSSLVWAEASAICVLEEELGVEELQTPVKATPSGGSACVQRPSRKRRL